MVTFSITFVLGLPRLEEKQKQKKQKQEKKTETKNDSTDYTNVGQEEVQTKYQVGKPLTCFHIEYFLTSDKNKFQADINCWESAAKVYVEDQTKILKTIIKDDITWLAFTVNHTISLSKQELEKLFTHTAKFCIFNSKKRLGNRANTDNPKAFYRAMPIRETDPGKIAFEELYSSAEVEEGDDFNSSMKGATEGEFTKTGNHEHDAVKLFALPESQHKEYARWLIKNFRIDDEHLCFKPTAKGKDSMGKAKTDKEASAKTLKEKTKKNTNEFSFTIEAKSFFSDLAKVTGEVKPLAPGLMYASGIVSARDLMTEEQAQKYNPLVIRISDLCNLPHKVLLEKRYQILDMVFETSQHKVKENIVFDITNVIMTSRFNPVKFIQFLQTGHLVLELIGVVEGEHKVKPSLFGQELYDRHLSKKLESTSPEVRCLTMLKESSNLVLATATYVLTGLVLGQNFHELSVNLQATNRLSHQKHHEESDFLSIEHIYKPENQTPFTNSMLFEENTCLSITVKIMAPLKPLLHRVQGNEDILNRIFMVIYDHDKAKEIVSNIYEINQDILGPTTITPDFEKTKANIYTTSISQANIDYLELPENRERSEYVKMMVEVASNRIPSGQSLPTLTNYETDSMKELDPSYIKKALTGFIIDAFDKIIVFVEGVSNGPLQHVWNDVMAMPSRMGQVLFNSDLIFESRLYPEFIPYGGFHIITLRVPLEMYLVNPRAFIEGYIPLSCWEALLNLDLLLKSNHISSACRQKLFPTTEALLSFDIEFGVPLHHQEPEKNYKGIFTESEEFDNED